MIVEVTVVPKSSKFQIIKRDGRIRICITSPAEDNKANIELIKELKKLGCQAAIVSGRKSRRKKLEVPDSCQALNI